MALGEIHEPFGRHDGARRIVGVDDDDDVAALGPRLDVRGIDADRVRIRPRRLRHPRILTERRLRHQDRLAAEVLAQERIRLRGAVEREQAVGVAQEHPRQLLVQHRLPRAVVGEQVRQVAFQLRQDRAGRKVHVPDEAEVQHVVRPQAPERLLDHGRATLPIERELRDPDAQVSPSRISAWIWAWPT